MNISKLEWDSDFFGFNIGRLIISEEDALPKFNAENFANYDLVYVFAPHELKIPDDELKLVDSKVVYRKTKMKPIAANPSIHLFVGKTPTRELYELALQSGEFSRFKLDEKFPNGSFEKLYRRWIEQSVRKVMADDLLCYFQEDKIVGMATVSTSNGVGHIGLVAVDSSCRNMGIGSELLAAVDSYFFEHKVFAVEVPTQLNNRNACLWYEKNGYEVHSITDIYHWWLK